MFFLVLIIKNFVFPRCARTDSLSFYQYAGSDLSSYSKRIPLLKAWHRHCDLGTSVFVNVGLASLLATLVINSTVTQGRRNWKVYYIKKTIARKLLIWEWNYISKKNLIEIEWRSFFENSGLNFVSKPSKRIPLLKAWHRHCDLGTSVFVNVGLASLLATLVINSTVTQGRRTWMVY
jgi:hypothetical protein